MSIRSSFPVQGVAVLALALALAVSGCSGSGDPKSADTTAAHARESTTTSPYGEPAYPDAAAAFAAITDYNTRNNALIPVASRPPYSKNAFTPVDSGPILAQDRWKALLAKADPSARTTKSWFYDRPLEVYLPAAHAWPKLVLSAGYSHTKGKKSPKPGRWAMLSVFAQPAVGAPLKHETGVWVVRIKLPEPLAPGAYRTVVDRSRAVALARALAKHWTDHTAAVPGFASTRILDADLERDHALPSGPNAISWTARLLGGAAGVRAVAVSGGTLVVADYTIRKTIRALGIGSLVYWSGDYAKVLGAAKRRSVSATTYSGAVWFMPTGTGKAVPLGETRAEAIF
jgi:hypothetical protein